MFSGPAVVYGSLALSPSRYKGMFKGIRSGNIEKALAGVRNAAWDMTLVRYWAESEGHEENRLFILGSLDDAVLDCATDYKVAMGTLNPGNVLAQRWEMEWHHHGRKLFEQYSRYRESHSTDKSRAALNHVGDTDYWNSMIDNLETELQERILRMAVV